MSKDWITDYIDEADFTGLFVEELGWSRPLRGGRSSAVVIDEGEITLHEEAAFHGITVWSCPKVPSSKIQRQIDREIRKLSTEHILIFHNSQQQIWLWPQSQDALGGGSPRLIAHEHRVGRENKALEQRLRFIAVGLHEDPSVLEIMRRLRRAFDSERVTRSFYVQFAGQLDDIIRSVEEASASFEPELSEVRLYGSILLNRLMFIYFMQRKGFLDGDPDYLRNRLRGVRALQGKTRFYEFYRDFLLPLFHGGLGSNQKPETVDPQIAALLGAVPYVNGGIFSVSQFEQHYEIHIPDDTFESVFDFFDQWQWHLDDRPTGNPNEINPDILGYIFEQFVNHRDEVSKGVTGGKQNIDKGAYYTKEDVTSFMASNTLVPRFLELLEKETGINPWRLVRKDPDRYIWMAVRHGVDRAFPGHVEETLGFGAMTGPSISDIPPEIALPGESWIEVKERRRWYASLKASAAAGEIDSLNRATMSNLDLETLAIDVIDAIDSPNDVAAVWRILSEIRIIDPTCGSGAFLFAALNILHRLYDAIFESALAHLSTADNALLQKIVDSASSHPNRGYFLLKHATLKNIYGVDIMPEAVEIARLRLFLKLISQIDKATDVEPLPDLEFNIRPGNILVGARDEEAIRGRVDILSSKNIDLMLTLAQNAAISYRLFAAAQEAGDHPVVRQAKTDLASIAGGVSEQLNHWWHQSNDTSLDYAEYVEQVRPFHWFIEFPDVFAAGGFDVVIGNPPYVAPSKIPYTIDQFETGSCPDIYAPCFERAQSILKDDGRMSMIVPISSQFGDDFESLRRMMKDCFKIIQVSTFDRRPDSLFGGNVGVRNTIWVCANGDSTSIGVTKTNRWVLSYRPFLFETIRYVVAKPGLMKRGWVRTGTEGIRDLFDHLVITQGLGLMESTSVRHGSKLGFKGNALYFLSVFVDPPPVIEADGSPGTPTMMGTLTLPNERLRDAALAVLLSKLAFVWWGITSDNLNVTVSGISSVPVNLARLADDKIDELALIGKRINSELPKHLSSSLYRGRQVSRYDIPAIRKLTDEADICLARALGFEERLVDLELAYSMLFKGSDDS